MNKESFNNITMVGLGYIGLPTAAIIAYQNKRVYGVDVNIEVVNKINDGITTISEPNLSTLVSSVVKSGWLTASTKYAESDAFVLAVPTPILPNKSPDLSYIESAAENISNVLKKGDLIILESTSPVGTTKKLASWIDKLRPDLNILESIEKDEANINFAYCPERVIPGRAIIELKENNRTIGGLTSKCSEKAVEFYSMFVEGELKVTNAETAEMVKLTENSFRDVNIAFANELSLITEEFDIDVWELIELANLHPRVNILKPSTGVGGHCIAIDPWFIVNSCKEKSRLIKTAREVNDNKPKFVAENILKTAIEKDVKKIGCLGLSFKPNIDDIRESPAIKVIEELSKSFDGEIKIVEPYVENLPANIQNLSNNITFSDLNTTLKECDLIAVLVAHSDFNNMLIKSDDKIILDFVNVSKDKLNENTLKTITT